MHNITLFVIDNTYGDYGPAKEQCFVQQILFDSKWIGRIGVNSKEINDPQFRKIEDILGKTRVAFDDYVILPIHNNDGKLILVIQLQLVSQNNDDHYSLTALEETLLTIVLTYLQLKIDKLKSDQDTLIARREVVQCIKLSAKVCTQRTFGELFKNMREALPKFFDFESVGILLKDQETQELFTFVETSDSKVMKNEKEEQDNYHEINAKNDVVTMKIPTKLGVTGHVYKTEEIYVCQNALKE